MILLIEGCVAAHEVVPGQFPSMPEILKLPKCTLQTERPSVHISISKEILEKGQPLVNVVDGRGANIKLEKV